MSKLGELISETRERRPTRTMEKLHRLADKARQGRLDPMQTLDLYELLPDAIKENPTNADDLKKLKSALDDHMAAVGKLNREFSKYFSALIPPATFE